VKVKPTKAKAEARTYTVFSLSGQRLDMPPAPKRTTVKEVAPISTETRFADLPDVLTPEQVWGYTGLGRNRVYDLMASNEIESKRVGQRLLTTKFALRRFLGVDVE
jgi:hypothetical protein